ncbi:BspA family leucine-rich repeat surface protein, partial [Bifidobacterium panos]
MRHAVVKAPSGRRGRPVKALAFLLAVAMMAVLAPMGFMPAQAEAVSGTLRNNNGLVLDPSINRSQVRSITFQSGLPDAYKKTCWDAGEDVNGDDGVSVRGCATAVTVDGNTMYDVVYGANNAYPSFPKDSSYLFSSNDSSSWFTGLVSINGLSQISTSNVTNMWSMFQGCLSLTELDVSGFNTSNVTSMGQMFAACSKLTSLNLSGWDTSKVTEMDSMFQGCSGLTKLDVSGFVTSKVTNMYGMFSGCSGLTELDLSSFNTRNVTSCTYMLSGLSNLQELTLGAKFNLKLSECTLGSPDAKAEAPSGYVNIGKWRNGTTGDVYESPSDIPTPPTGMVTYTPFAPEYTVEFDANAADASGSMDPQKIAPGAGQKLSPNKFSREGYSFAGWNTKRDGKGVYYDDEAVMNRTAADGLTVNLYAQWTAKENNKVSFNVTSDGVLADGVKTQLTVTTDTELKKAAGYKQPDVTAIAGKKFLGWQLGKDGPVYQPDQIGDLTVKSDVTFTAKYEDLPNVEVHF